MSLSSRSRFRGLAATSAAVVFAVAGGAAALADIVRVNDVVSGTTTMSLSVGGATRLATYYIDDNPGGNDPDPGCNMDTSTEKVTLSLAASTPGIVSISPTTLTFSNCGTNAAQAVSVAPVAAGTVDITVTVTGNNTGGDFNTNPGKLTVNVSAPTATATTTTVTCTGAPFTYTGSAVTPCSATTKTSSGTLVASPQVVYSDNVNGGTATATATYVASGAYLGSSDSKTFVIDPATPKCSIDGYTGTYDGKPHGASGSCVGVKGEALDGLTLGDSYTDAPGGTAYWAIPESTNYTAADGSVAIILNQASPTCSIDGYTGTYDGNAHGATGSCTGVKGEHLDGLALGAFFTDVPGGTAHWALGSSTNYTAAGGDVPITITKADATCSVSGYTGAYDGNPHGASGSCTGVKGEVLTGLDLGAGFTKSPGGTANWTFTNPNYNDQHGSVSIVIEPWVLKGFYSPVDMNGVWNTVKNGSTVPLKFELFAGTTELTPTSSVDGFTIKGVACPTTGVTTDDIELVTTGGTSLRYDSTGGQFVQNWQTPKKAGACYTVTMRAMDGSSISANFKLK